MDPIPECDIVVDQKDYEEGLHAVLKVVRPNWEKKDIKIKYLKQGYVNHMLVCYINEDKKDDWIVARIFGTHINFGFERDVEIKNSQLFAETKIGPPVYGIFKNGLLFKFVQGKTFFWDDLSAFRDIKLCKAIVRELAKVHSKKTCQLAIDKYEILNAKTIEDKMTDILGKPWPDVIIDEETTKWYNSKVPSPEERLKECTMLFDNMKKYQRVGTRFCHGDCNPTNIIYDEENDKATLIDFEGAGLSLPLFDLVGFLSMAAYGLTPNPEGLDYTPEFKAEIVSEYLREMDKCDGGPGEVDEKVLQEHLVMMEIMDISFCYFWHLMGLIMATSMPAGAGADNKFFLHIGIGRLEYYMKNRDRLLAMKIPE